MLQVKSKKILFYAAIWRKNTNFAAETVRLMTEIHKKYRLTSMEEPTDEMLQELMEDVAKAARESSVRAEEEKRRRLSETALIISKRRLEREAIVND